MVMALPLPAGQAHHFWLPLPQVVAVEPLDKMVVAQPMGRLAVLAVEVDITAQVAQEILQVFLHHKEIVVVMLLVLGSIHQAVVGAHLRLAAHSAARHPAMVALVQQTPSLAHPSLMLAAEAALQQVQREAVEQVVVVLAHLAQVQQQREQLIQAVAVAEQETAQTVHLFLVALAAQVLSSSATLALPNSWLVVLSPSLVVMSSTHSHQLDTWLH